MFRALISCGGTGGHIYPGLAIGRALKQEKEFEILFVGRKNGMEERMIKSEGFNFEGINSGKLIRRVSLRNIINIIVVVRGVFQSSGIIKRFNPDIIIGLGGYVSAPVIIAGKLKAKKIMIHEQNAVPGLANRVLSSFSRKVLVSFEKTKAYFGQKAVYAGNPVRDEIGKAEKNASRARFGLDTNKKTVAVIGGSQGAHNLNGKIYDALKLLDASKIQIIWMTGKNDFEFYSGKEMPKGLNAIIRPYFDNIAEVYAAADLIVSRAGASTLFEIFKCSLPAVLVPLSTAANNHQYINAQEAVKNNGAVCFDENKITAQELAETINKLFADENKLKAMSKNMGRLYKRDSIEIIIREAKTLL